MNIGLFTDCYSPAKNGVVTSIVHLKEGLEKRGHCVTVVSTSSPTLTSEERNLYRLPSVPIYPDLNLKFCLNPGQRIQKIINEGQFDVVHTHTEFSIARAAKKIAIARGIPCVHTLHTDLFDYRHYLPLADRFLSKTLIDKAYSRFLEDYDAVICPSKKTAKNINKKKLMNNKYIVSNGVDSNLFKPPCGYDREYSRSRFGISPDEKLILYAGRIAKEKRSLELLYSLVPVLSDHKNVKLLMVGSGHLVKIIKKEIDRLGLDKQVIFPGWVDWTKMREFYWISDVFATVSLSEICPMTLIEAQVCGLPVVARRDEGISCIVSNEKNGLLVDEDTQMSDAVSRIFFNQKTYENYSIDAKKSAAKFHIDQTVANIVTVYQKTIAQKVPDSTLND